MEFIIFCQNHGCGAFADTLKFLENEHQKCLKYMYSVG